MNKYYERQVIIIKKLINRYKMLPVQIRASFWFLICSFLQRGIAMICTPIFTRIMTTAEYGQYGVYNSWYSIVSIFVGLGLTGGVHTQGLIKFDDDREIFSSSLQGLTTSMILGWSGIYFAFHSFWNALFSLPSIYIISMLLMAWSTSIFGFWANEQRVEYSYRLLVGITLLISFIQPLVGILLVIHATDKVTARIFGIVIVDFLGYFWMYILQMKRGEKFFSKKYWIYALAFNLPLIPHYLSQTLLNSADRIMIQNIVGESEAGIYSLAYSVSLIMTLFNSALTQTLNPWIYQKIKDRRIKDISHIAYSTLIIVALVNLMLIMFAPEVVAIFAPKTYYEAIWVIPPVAMSVFFMYCYDLFSKFAFYYEKTKFVMVASIIGAILNIILNYFFISKFGYIAAGYTTLLCYIVYAFMHYLFMKKVCQDCCNGEYPYETKKIMIISILFLSVGFILLVTYQYPFYRYGIMFVSIIIIFFMRKKIIAMIRNMLQIKNKAIKNR